MYITMTQSGVTVNQGVPSLERMQEIVGGYITCLLRIPSSVSGVTIDVWCNDEGNLLDLPRHYARLTDGYKVAGNIVATGGRESDGETVSLAEADKDILMKYIAHTH